MKAVFAYAHRSANMGSGWENADFAVAAGVKVPENAGLIVPI